MSKKIKNIAIVASSTLGSRVLGLLRDTLMFAFLGAGTLNSAFLVAFLIPNLFRRLLGEGALTSALIPILLEELHTKGQSAAFRFLNQLLSWTLLVLTGLIVGMIGVVSCVRLVPGLEDRWYLGAQFEVILMPYMLLVCLAAALSAALNIFGRFAIAATSQIWLNLSMIISLGVFGYCYEDSTLEQVYYLCAGVLIGGFLQFLLPAIRLVQTGWRPKLDFTITPQLKKWFHLFIPGVTGAAIIQINFMIVNFLAFTLSASAVSTLYLANRLIQFPQGLFTISIITVFFPSLSKLAVDPNNRKDLKALYLKGARMLLAITVPAAVGLILLRKPIVSLLFEWGRFNAADVQATQPILAILALTLPFYALTIFATRGFHALKDTKTPYKVALINFCLNITLSFILMKLLGEIGLALANLSSSIFQCFVLSYKLNNKDEAFKLDKLLVPVFQITVGLSVLIIAVLSLLNLWNIFFPFSGKLYSLGLALTIIPISTFLYLGTLWLMGFEDKAEIKDYWQSFLAKRRSVRAS